MPAAALGSQLVAVAHNTGIPIHRHFGIKSSRRAPCRRLGALPVGERSPGAEERQSVYPYTQYIEAMRWPLHDLPSPSSNVSAFPVRSPIQRLGAAPPQRGPTLPRAPWSMEPPGGRGPSWEGRRISGSQLNRRVYRHAGIPGRQLSRAEGPRALRRSWTSAPHRPWYTGIPRATASASPTPEHRSPVGRHEERQQEDPARRGAE